MDGEFLARAAWPVARAGDVSVRAAEQFGWVQDMIVALRGVRSEYAVPPGKKIDAVYVARGDRRLVLEAEGALVARIARTTLSFAEAVPDGAAATVILTGGTELVVPLDGLVDVDKECAKLRTELAGLDKQLAALEGRLANAGFVSRAPVAVVEAERAKRDEWSGRAAQLRARIEALCGAG